MKNWTIDLEQQQAVHINGAKILFSGDPDSNYFDGKPTSIPKTITAAEQANLIRTGFEAYRITYRRQMPKKAHSRRHTRRNHHNHA